MLINGRNMLRSTLRLACFPLFVNVMGINKRNTFILLPCCVCLLSQFSQEASCLFFFFFLGGAVFGKTNAECTRVCEEEEGGEKNS